MNQKLFLRLSTFFDNIAVNDRIALLHHTDADGLCSGVITAKFLKRYCYRDFDLVFNQRNNELTLTDATVDKLFEKKITKLIIVDMAVDEDPFDPGRCRCRH